MEKNLRIVSLYDTYGELLTSRQREIMEMSFNDDLSLGEIAEELSISRQSVRDSLVSSEKLLTEFERKLGFLKKKEDLLSVAEELSQEEKTRAQSARIKEILEN